MYRILTVLILILPCKVTLAAEQLVRLAGEADIIVSEGWFVTGDAAQFPIQIINHEQTADLLIFKSIISADQVITNAEELKHSVDKVVTDVIHALPQASLISNTGYFEKNRVSFCLEFTTSDTINNESLHHRLVGVIYSHPEGYQLLFTLWGKASDDGQELLRGELQEMQEGFRYEGAAETAVFSGERRNWLWLLGAFPILILAWYLFKARRKSDRVKFSEDVYFWRCDCGRLNPRHLNTCRRCGQSLENKVKT